MKEILTHYKKSLSPQIALYIDIYKFVLTFLNKMKHKRQFFVEYILYIYKRVKKDESEMANSYHKLLNNQIKTSYKEKFIAGLHEELKRSVRAEGDDLFSMVNSLEQNNKPSKLDINLLLKYYMLNQIIDGSKEEVSKQQYHDTKNPSIKKDENGKYYRVVDNSTVLDENIVSVNTDGSYIVQEKQNVNSIKIQRIYDIDNKALSVQVVDIAGNKIMNKNLAAELIGLKREYKKKYKYSGYSGNSSDMLAGIRNMLSTPVETGYYMDFHCVFYKWSSVNSCFVRAVERDSDSPLLVDIEFRDNGTIIRQEYTGIVA